MTNLPAIVVIADAWGSKHGGVNTFSTSLCVGLAETLTSHRVVCLCEEADEADRTSAQSEGVTLVAFKSLFEDPIDQMWDPLLQELRSVGVEQVAWWAGNDVITGPLALNCAGRYNGSKCAIVMHMSYMDYQYVKHPPEEAPQIEQKVAAQKAILGAADLGFAVGPLLFERLKEIRRDRPSVQLVPGLSNVIPRETTEDRLHAITFGRFNPSEALIKQAPLAVAAFAEAVRVGVDSNNIKLAHAHLKVVGAPTAVIDDLRHLARERAGRVVNLEGHEFVENDKLVPLLQECNVCMMLSWHEGFGLSAWEAIGAGVPVVLSKNSGVYRFLDSLGGSITGCVVPVDVRGDEGGQPNEDDIQVARAALLGIASDLGKAKANAKQLRQELRLRHNLTWHHTARTFASALSLPTTDSMLDLLRPSPARTSMSREDFFESAEIANAQRVLKSADDCYQCGQYTQALEIIEGLRDYACLRYAPEVVLDAAISSAQVYMRLNRYRPAMGIVKEASQETRERREWGRHVRAKLVENVILRDQGKYGDAISLDRELLKIASAHCPDYIERVQRALARSLALNEEIDEAIEHAESALKSAESRIDGIAGAKAMLALGEAFRHGRDYARAEMEYNRAQDRAAKGGHTDCLLWSLLGLSDCAFLQDNLRVSSDVLAGIRNFVSRGPQAHPLESLHIRLSFLAIEIVQEEADQSELDNLLKRYEELGIKWPGPYFEGLRRGDERVPRKM